MQRARGFCGLCARAKLVFEPHAKADQRGGVDLRNARFADAEDRADFLHGQLLEVIKRDNLALFCTQIVESPGHQRGHFPAQAKEKGIVLSRAGAIANQFVFGLRLGRFGLEAAQVEPA